MTGWAGGVLTPIKVEDGSGFRVEFAKAHDGREASMSVRDLEKIMGDPRSGCENVRDIATYLKKMTQEEKDGPEKWAARSMEQKFAIVAREIETGARVGVKVLHMGKFYIKPDSASAEHSLKYLGDFAGTLNGWDEIKEAMEDPDCINKGTIQDLMAQRTLRGDEWGNSILPDNMQAQLVAEDLASGKRVAVIQEGGMFSSVAFPKKEDVRTLNHNGFPGSLEGYAACSRGPDVQDVQTVVSNFPEGFSYSYE